jgi:uncharacterized protein YdaU (DUF1376 family)
VVKKAEYMHYYQFHIGDYKSHTHHLSLLEDLAYRRLLDFYFLHEKPIKHRDVARQIGMREHEEDVMTVLNEFFISTEDGFVSPRADKEIKQYKEFAEAGKRGAAKRWGTPPNGEAISPPNAAPIATINQEPLTTNHKPIYKDTNVSLSAEGLPTCPHQDILLLYKKHLPHLTQPRVWEGNRQVVLKSRWIQAAKPSNYSPEGYKTKEDGLKWWDSFFGYIANDSSLANGFKTKDRTWLPDLEWITNATNFAKIIDGKYAK